MDNQLSKITKDIESSRGYMHYRVIVRINALYRVLEGNYREMKKTHNVHISATKFREDLIIESQEEQRRTMFNFLSSTYAYNEHLKAIVREFYENEEICIKFEKKVEELHQDDLYRFVKDFRNYFTHDIIPVIYAWPREDGVLIHQTSKDKLREFTGWKPKGRKFFESFEDDMIPLFPLFERCMEMIKDFVEWLKNELFSDYNDEIEDFWGLVDRRDRKMNCCEDLKKRWKSGERNLVFRRRSEKESAKIGPCEVSVRLELGEDY